MESVASSLDMGREILFKEATFVGVARKELAGGVVRLVQKGPAMAWSFSNFEVYGMDDEPKLAFYLSSQWRKPSNKPSRLNLKTTTTKLPFPGSSRSGDIPFRGDDSSDSEDLLADGPRVPPTFLCHADNVAVGEPEEALTMDPLKVRWVFLGRQPRTLGGIVHPVAEAHLPSSIVKWDRLPEVAAELHAAREYVEDYRTRPGGRSPLHGATPDAVKALAVDQMRQLGKDEKVDCLSLAEFEQVLRRMGVKVTSYEAAKYYDMAVTDWAINPLLSMSELCLALTMLSLVQQQHALLPADLYFLFDPHRHARAANKQERGPLDVLAFFCIMNCHGYKMSQSKARKQFAKIDLLEAKLIGYDEFLELWLEEVNVRKELNHLGFNAADASVPGVLDGIIKAETKRRGDQLAEATQMARDLRKSTRDLKGSKTADARKKGTHDAKKKRREKAEHARVEQLAEAKREAEKELYDSTLQRLLHKAAVHSKTRRDRFYKVQHEERQAIRDHERHRFQTLRLDRVDLSNQGFAVLPSDLWAGSKASSSGLIHIVNLNLSGNRLWELPGRFLYWLGSIRQFNASYNAIRAIPEEVAAMTEAWDVNLGHNAIASLPATVSALRSLRRLDVSDNRLSELPASLCELTTLECLRLFNNAIKQLPDGFPGLTNLVDLSLSSNRLSYLPEDFPSLTSLMDCDLSWNSLRELPPTFGALRGLTTLDLSHNRLVELPSSIGTLVGLEVFNLSTNELKALPEAIGNLCNLVSLDLTRNRLVSLPASIGGVSSLQELSLRHNNLVELPRMIGLMIDLQVLDAAENQLSVIPLDMAACGNLRRADFSRNQLGDTAIPGSVSAMYSLEWLDLSSNCIHYLPEKFGALRCLTHLDLTNNTMPVLPLPICNLTTLTRLEISNNRLSFLPQELVSMQSLTVLNANTNILKSLPADLVRLRNLEELFLYNNRLAQLPLSLAPLLPQLRSFDCSRNPLAILPPKFMNRDVEGAGTLPERLAHKAGEAVALGEAVASVKLEVKKADLEARDEAMKKEAAYTRAAGNGARRRSDVGKFFETTVRDDPLAHVARRLSIERGEKPYEVDYEQGVAPVATSLPPAVARAPAPAVLSPVAPSVRQAPSPVRTKRRLPRFTPPAAAPAGGTTQPEGDKSPGTLPAVSGARLKQVTIGGTAVAPTPQPKRKGKRGKRSRSKDRKPNPQGGVEETKAEVEGDGGLGAVRVPTPPKPERSRRSSFAMGAAPRLRQPGTARPKTAPVEDDKDDDVSDAPSDPAADGHKGSGLVEPEWAQRAPALYRLRRLSIGKVPEPGEAGPRLVEMATRPSDLYVRGRWNLMGYEGYSGDPLQKVVVRNALDRRYAQRAEARNALPLQAILNAKRADRRTFGKLAAERAHRLAPKFGDGVVPPAPPSTVSKALPQVPALAAAAPPPQLAVRPAAKAAKAAEKQSKPKPGGGSPPPVAPPPPSTLSRPVLPPRRRPVQAPLPDKKAAAAELTASLERMNALMGPKVVAPPDSPAALPPQRRFGDGQKNAIMGGPGGAFTSGYDTADAAEFVTVNYALRPHMHAVWAATADLHLMHKGTVELFTEDVRTRMGSEWQALYIPLVQRFYAEAKRSGAPTVYEFLTADQLAAQESMRRHMDTIKAERFDRVKELHAVNKEMGDARYGITVDELARRVEIANVLHPPKPKFAPVPAEEVASLNAQVKSLWDVQETRAVEVQSRKVRQAREATRTLRREALAVMKEVPPPPSSALDDFRVAVTAAKQRIADARKQCTNV